jgi:hypothetical protein
MSDKVAAYKIVSKSSIPVQHTSVSYAQACQTPPAQVVGPATPIPATPITPEIDIATPESLSSSHNSAPTMLDPFEINATDCDRFSRAYDNHLLRSALTIKYLKLPGWDYD